MYHVELYARVRRACMVEGMSVREASRVFGLHRDTLRKMLAWPVSPGYRRQDPPRRPKLEPFTGVIDAILEADRQVPRKQRHTAKRVFERLRDEHGFDGSGPHCHFCADRSLIPATAAAVCCCFPSILFCLNSMTCWSLINLVPPYRMITTCDRQK